MHRKYFTLPYKDKISSADGGNEKVAVVSVFGKTPLDALGHKCSPLEYILGRNLFSQDLLKNQNVNPETMCGIDGFFDMEKKVLYLHLSGTFDTAVLAASLEDMSEMVHEKGFLVAWSELQYRYARALLLLFSVSHILLLAHPSHVFDLTYIHLFRTLDAVRSKAQTAIGEVLKGTNGVSRDWLSYGRLCTPRVLFLFSSKLLPLHVLKSAYENCSNNRTSRFLSSPPSSLRDLELALEDQIYRLLRKSRVITNISANSLFALPSNQPFVYITEPEQEKMSAVPLLHDSLVSLCSCSESAVEEFSAVGLGAAGRELSKLDRLGCGGTGKTDLTFITLLSEPSQANVISNTLLGDVSSERTRNLRHSFEHFLQTHIDLALGKGFDDNVGWHAGHSFFEVPKLKVWFEVTNKLFNFFVLEDPEKDSRAKHVLSSLKNLLETDIRFSDSRCAKVLPMAISAYKEGLPSHYTQAQHLARLEMALGVLATQARGPMFDSYMSQLSEACEAIWKDGHLGCETLSLTGSTCQHQQHRSSHDEEGNLPILVHSSGVVYTNYCNCGGARGQMDDPFDVREGNYTFYEKMSEVCCGQLESYPFPSFSSSVEDAKAAKLDATLASIAKDTFLDPLPSHMRDNVLGGFVGVETPHSPSGLSLGGTGLSQHLSQTEPIQMEEGGSNAEEIIVTVTEEECKTTLKEKPAGRQASTTEYLPGMLHTLSPAGLLPQFSSWSLVCLGPSSLYSHNAGICDQPGFLPGTNFLLPWDVTVKIQDKDKWPAIAEFMGRKGFLLKNKKSKMSDVNEFTVKIFLGTEFQCNRGHRFMMAAPDRHLKATSSGLVKDTAVKIATADMPLYFPCPCSRSGNFIHGQLMRVHIVTPKAPVHVTLNPRVQPGPDPCPQFIPFPSSTPPVKLTASTYWVLRLPYVYVGDQGPYYPPGPRHQAPTSLAKFLRGCYGISEIALKR